MRTRTDKPWRERRDMTVCIAAVCTDGDDEKIILCSDTKWGGALGSREGGLKQLLLPHGWVCLTAGKEPDIASLIRLFTEHFIDEGKLHATKIDATIKQVLYRRKSELAEEYVQRHFGKSYDYFLKHGKAEFSSDHFFQTSQAITRIDLGASFILAGFIEGMPEIYYTDEHCVARPAPHYAVIGEGEYVASASLLRRGLTTSAHFHYAMYFVYEAKRQAESVPSVGTETVMTVLSAKPEGGTKVNIMSEEYEKSLKEWFVKYGPQNMQPLKFEGNLWYERKKDKG